MNKQRRKILFDCVEALTAARDALQTIADEEREYFDNMPESLQSSERGQNAEAASDTFQQACDDLDGVINELEGISE